MCVFFFCFVFFLFFIFTSCPCYIMSLFAYNEENKGLVLSTWQFLLAVLVHTPGFATVPACVHFFVYLVFECFFIYTVYRPYCLFLVSTAHALRPVIVTATTVPFSAPSSEPSTTLLRLLLQLQLLMILYGPISP